jgi:hypothetical protein
MEEALDEMDSAARRGEMPLSADRNFPLAASRSERQQRARARR